MSWRLAKSLDQLRRQVNAAGYYGPATEKIVRNFQTEKRLGTDGIIGPKTWAAAWTSNIT